MPSKGQFTAADLDQDSPKPTGAFTDTDVDQESAPIQPGNAFTSGTPWQTLKANYNEKMTPKPGDTSHEFGRGVLENTVAPAISAISHPIDTIMGLGKMAVQSAPPVALYNQLSGHPERIPGASTGENTANEIQKNGMKSLPHIAGEATGLGLASGLGEAVPNIPKLIKGTGEAGGVATPSLLNRVGIGKSPSSLSPIERSAVDITKAVNPQQSAWNNYLESSQAQTGNVIDYAKRNGMPINDARDFAKAAKGAADETRQHYQKNFLGPNADTQVSVPGSYQGNKIGEGNRATLGDVNNRIDAINRDLKSNFRKPTPGQVSSAGASDAELEAEHRALTDLLHNKLGDLTGVSPEEIKSLRVRGGQLSTLSGETQGAANTVSGAAAKGNTGAPAIPTSSGGLLKEGITALRGGPEKIAASNLRKALSNAPMESSPLLQPGSPTPFTSPRINPPITGKSTPFQTFDATPDMEAANLIQNKIASRNLLRDTAAEQNKKSATQEFLHANDLEQAAQNAGNIRADYAQGMRERLGNASRLDRTGGRDFRKPKTP